MLLDTKMIARPMTSTAPSHSHPEMHRPSVTSAALRQAFSWRAAGTSIVTTRDQAGHLFGLTATAVTSVSLDPPLVLVCVDNSSRTAAVLQAHAPFVVQFLSTTQESLARRFASPVPDRFAGITYHLTPSGCPQFEGVLASIECAPYQTYPGGDHIIVIGRVVDVQVSNDNALPLIYFRSQFLNQ